MMLEKVVNELQIEPYSSLINTSWLST